MPNIISVAGAYVGNGHPCHVMVLDCILADIKKDDQGNPVLTNGKRKLRSNNYLSENYSFKFKNTYRDEKEIILKAGKIIYLRIHSHFSIHFYTFSIQITSTRQLYFTTSTLTLFLQSIDLIPPKKEYCT